MRSIKRSFDTIKANNPNWGDYACLAETVKYKGYCRRQIYMHFKQLVSEEDYLSNEVNRLVRYLWKLSNTAEEDTFLQNFGRRGDIKSYPNIHTKTKLLAKD